MIKVLTTGMGEAASDGLGETSLVLGGVVGVGGFFLALWLQLRSDRYHAPTYWFCVSMVAVFGTIMADILHVATGLSYYVTSLFYAVVVGALFTWWHRSEGTLSIHHIDTRRRERFYWATVLATFALGTAVGDLTGLTMTSASCRRACCSWPRSWCRWPPGGWASTARCASGPPTC